MNWKSWWKNKVTVHSNRINPDLREQQEKRVYFVKKHGFLRNILALKEKKVYTHTIRLLPTGNHGGKYERNDKENSRNLKGNI